MEEPEVIKKELIQDRLDEVTSDATDSSEKIEEKIPKAIVKILFPEKWKKHFGNTVDEVTILQRIHYWGNWEVLRPAQAVDGLDFISEELLKKLNDKAQSLIEKMRCAV